MPTVSIPDTMTLPAYLRTSSPPRSPHTAPPGMMNSFFAPPASGSSGRPGIFRPTRRDLLLCLLTLSFSYLLFSTPAATTSLPIPKTSYTVGKWSFFSQDQDQTSCPTIPVTQSRREPTFGESVQTHGLVRAPVINSALRKLDQDVGPEFVGDSEVIEIGIDAVDGQWDGGEEADEDDELEAGSTVLRGFQPGWTLVDRLYIYNGSFYVVTTQRNDWPELRLMTSTGLPANNEPGNLEAREPIGNEIIFITPKEAAKLWGSRVYQMEGMTWLFNDGQFIDHYYHFVAELLMGAWRTYACMDPDITPQGETTLPPPQRMWFLHQDVFEWRDRPRFNPTVLFALFPSVSLLYPNDFDDLRISTTSFRPKAYVMEHALLADRSAAFRGPWTGPTARTVASALQVGKASRWWWEPIRRQILRYSGVPENVIARNLEGFGSVDPATLEIPNANGVAAEHGIGIGVKDLEPLAPSGSYKPIVTYISRQSSRRHLTDESHDGLVKAMEKRAKSVAFEFIIVEAEKLTKEEQIALAANTTIMLGVHGNGLTHLVWMPATPRSTVIEMFYRGGFARDYQWTAHALGIKHFAVQHDVAFTAPNIPSVAYPEGFQGTEITVDGEKVADIVEARLKGTL